MQSGTQWLIWEMKKNCFISEKTSQNSPNHTTINWRQIRDFCSKGARVALDRLQRGVLGGLKQEERKEREQRNNCHGRPQCTPCKSKKSGFRLKLRIKKLSLRTIWRKSQKGFSYLWLNWNLKTVYLDWLQVCPIGFEKGTFLKSTFEKINIEMVFRFKKSILTILLIKKGPQSNQFSCCDSFPKNPMSSFWLNLCICSK